MNMMCKVIEGYATALAFDYVVVCSMHHSRCYTKCLPIHFTYPNVCLTFEFLMSHQSSTDDASEFGS